MNTPAGSPVVLLTGTPGVGKTTAVQAFLGLLRQHARQAGTEAVTMMGRVQIRGFLTREVRGARGREGFEVVLCRDDDAASSSSPSPSGSGGGSSRASVGDRGTATPRTVLLAHEAKIKHADRLPRVSKYTVDIPTFEALVVPELSVPPEQKEAEERQPLTVVYLIDEIGKMECFSTAFKTKVSKLLDYHARQSSLDQASSDGSQHTKVYVVGTIALKTQDRFIESIKARADVQLLEVTRENRDGIPARMMGLLFGDMSPH